MKTPNVRSWLSRFGWLAVAGAALAISTWSLFWVGRHFGLPVPIACLVSASFDGAALVSADLALRYARTHGDSGFLPRFFVFVFAGSSAYLNSTHAGLAGFPNPARVLFAVPPIVAVVVFELHDRWERRRFRRAAGRVPAALPAFGMWAWCLFPRQTLHNVKAVVEFRMNNAVSAARGELSGPVLKTRPLGSRTSSELGTNPEPEFDDEPELETDHRFIRTWAKAQGIAVNPTGPVRAPVRELYRAKMNGSSS